LLLPDGRSELLLPGEHGQLRDVVDDRRWPRRGRRSTGRLTLRDKLSAFLHRVLCE
jgi:hypothetical protein